MAKGRQETAKVSQRWRRITFIHNTRDRLQAAPEINDLFAEGVEFVDRIYQALRGAGLAPERRYPLREAGAEYIVDLAVPCCEGVLGVELGDAEPHRPESLLLTPRAVIADLPAWLQVVHTKVDPRGGTQSHPE